MLRKHPLLLRLVELVVAMAAPFGSPVQNVEKIGPGQPRLPVDYDGAQFVPFEVE